jgi:hypothetical protein
MVAMNSGDQIDNMFHPLEAHPGMAGDVPLLLSV